MAINQAVDELSDLENPNYQNTNQMQNKSLVSGENNAQPQIKDELSSLESGNSGQTSKSWYSPSNIFNDIKSLAGGLYAGNIADPYNSIGSRLNEMGQKEWSLVGIKNPATPFPQLNPNPDVLNVPSNQQNLLTSGLYGTGYWGPSAIGLAGTGLKLGSKIAEMLTGDVNGHAQNILNNLSQGKSWIDNQKSIADDIRTAAQNHSNYFSPEYNRIKQAAGTGSIYDQNSPYNYINLNQEELNNYLGRDTKKLNDKFLKTPNFENSFDLQKQIGSDIRDLEFKKSKGGGLDSFDLNKLSFLNDAKNSLYTDNLHHLNTIQPGLGDDFLKVAEYYHNNYAPFVENPIFNKMINNEGYVPNAAEINRTFETPDTNDANTSSVLSQMGDQFKNKILYSRIGQNLKNLTPENLSNIREVVGEKYAPYITPDLEEKMSNLQGRMKWEDVAKTIGSGGIAGALSLLFPHVGPELGIASGIAGSALPWVKPLLGIKQKPLSPTAISAPVKSLADHLKNSSAFIGATKFSPNPANRGTQ